MSDAEINMPISAVEMQECLFSETLVKMADKTAAESDTYMDWSKLKKEIRRSFRYQRFAVMNWLLMNGVSIPAELLTDDAHPIVGSQYPDEVKVR